MQLILNNLSCNHTAIHSKKWLYVNIQKASANSDFAYPGF